MSIFRSFVNDEPVVTASQMAEDLARETCETLVRLRAEAVAREQAAEPPMLATDEQAECYRTLEALLKGRHRRVVLPVMLSLLPDLSRPTNAAERAAVEAMLAQPTVRH